MWTFQVKKKTFSPYIACNHSFAFVHSEPGDIVMSVPSVCSFVCPSHRKSRPALNIHFEDDPVGILQHCLKENRMMGPASSEKISSIRLAVLTFTGVWWTDRPTDTSHIERHVSTNSLRYAWQQRKMFREFKWTIKLCTCVTWWSHLAPDISSNGCEVCMCLEFSSEYFAIVCFTAETQRSRDMSCVCCITAVYSSGRP